MELLEKANKQLILLLQIEQSIRLQTKDAPKGILRLSKSNGTFQYYSIKNGKRHYIRKKELTIAQALAQRDYNKKLQTFLKSNIYALKIFTKHYAPQKCTALFQKLPAARKTLIKPAFVDNLTYAKQWQAQKHEPMGTLRQNG